MWRRDALAARRAELAALDAEAEASRADLVDRLATARTRIAALTATIDAARRAVDAARGGYATVAERVAQATAVRDAARAAVDARADAQRAATRAAQARADADERIAASVFDDAAAAMAALQDLPRSRRWREQISAHDTQLAATRARCSSSNSNWRVRRKSRSTPSRRGRRSTPPTRRARRRSAPNADAYTVVERLRDLGEQIDEAYAGVAHGPPTPRRSTDSPTPSPAARRTRSR